MIATLPKSIEEIQDWQWTYFEPFFQELAARSLSAENIHDWLVDWTKLADLINGRLSSLRVAVSQNTADKESEQQLNDMLKNIIPPFRSAENRLIKILLASGLEPEGMRVPLLKLRAEDEIFSEANLLLLTEEEQLGNDYFKIIGAQTVNWEGQELTLTRLKLLQLENDRALREKAWKVGAERQLQDREALNGLWVKLLDLRQTIAHNAGLNNYRDYIWKQYSRFDYTPQDCLNFHDAIEEVVVPAAKRILERRRQRLGYDSLRPWDLAVDAEGLPALRPFADATELEQRAEAIFNRVDPDLGGYYSLMRQEKLLDLGNRMNKAPGGYKTYLLVKGEWRSFIFMNAVGVESDVITLLHEAGHSFHGFEVMRLPYSPQRSIGAEFNEVASMAMELLASPYLAKNDGGYYNEADAARARIAHLEKIILFWPYMAVVDAFQHWVYSNPNAAREAATCDQKWGELWQRFMGGEDWSGLEDARVTGWHRKLHIFVGPFYYVEYGMAQLGAIQIWANSLRNHKQAVADYRKAHRLGGTASLPDLYATAGAKFAFDVPMLKMAVDLCERTIAELEK